MECDLSLHVREMGHINYIGYYYNYFSLHSIAKTMVWNWCLLLIFLNEHYFTVLELILP